MRTTCSECGLDDYHEMLDVEARNWRIRFKFRCECGYTWWTRWLKPSEVTGE